MRSKHSVKNIFSSLAINVLTIVIGFVAQAVFIKSLGSEYLGLNGLFSNIISMLAISELGIGAAIIYSLYKPLSNKDYDSVKSLMKFYKKCYLMIAVSVMIIGLILVPFLNSFVQVKSINQNIVIVFLLFLFEAIISYVFSYKRSILIADQKQYYINFLHIFYLIILNGLQIVVLLKTKNYYLYLILKIICRVIENIAINFLVNFKYRYLKAKDARDLNKTEYRDIIKKVKALFFHKVGSFIVLGTDNIIISVMFGLTTVGLYSNYFLIVNSVVIIFGQFFNGITASVGNLLVTSSKSKIIDIYKKIRFGNAWISIVTAIAILVLTQDFIRMWIGNEYLLSYNVLIALVINYYLQSMRSASTILKEAAGVFHEDRFIPLLESVINIAFSIIFAYVFGLVGVIIGTICSNLILHLYSYPKYVYRKILHYDYSTYIKEFGKYFAIFIVCLLCTVFLSSLVSINNIYISILVKGILVLVIPNIILYTLFYKNREFNYYIDVIKIYLKIKN